MGILKQMCQSVGSCDRSPHEPSLPCCVFQGSAPQSNARRMWSGPLWHHVLSLWYCRLISICRPTTAQMSAFILSLRSPGPVGDPCVNVHRWHHPHILQVHSFFCVFHNVVSSCQFECLTVSLGSLFRTYWSSALMVSPSGSAPYPATGGGRWDAARSNRECWSQSAVCGETFSMKVGNSSTYSIGVTFKSLVKGWPEV